MLNDEPRGSFYKNAPVIEEKATLFRHGGDQQSTKIIEINGLDTPAKAYISLLK